VTLQVVGKGPSLLRLTRADFGPGPVLTLNHAITAVRLLGLPNEIFTMQKDGCVVHDVTSTVPLGCVCPSPRMVPPLPGETLILSAAESSRCFPDHRPRVVVDVEALGCRWNTMSVEVAVRLAKAMGHDSLRMLAFDAYTSRDHRRVDGDRLVRVGGNAYTQGDRRADRWARANGLRIQWLDVRRSSRVRSRLTT
jgi:hypothetical protein